MAKFDKRPVLEVMGKVHNAHYEFGLEWKICEAIYREFSLERLEQIHLALRPIFLLVGRQCAIKEKGLPKSPNFKRAIIEAKHEQLRLLEEIYNLGVSFECEHLIIALNEKMGAELERFESAELGEDPDSAAALAQEIQVAWAKLMPDKDWQLYRLSERADEETHGGSSLDFARLVIASIPCSIRPSLRSLFG
ncbi:MULTISPECIES: hypothetical protein [Aeromonas]|uniref:hypothetical protein n=1 Tax=Aeromonas TaxID=642 RepID=UPI001322CD2C|nr:MULTISPECIES: hypothetical protein [Aeromonas]MXQ69643.1 hypothetical protein [Aeromonas caviae]UWH29442.1 hypothetical protein KW556_07110 [Aeromonas veronii]